jgi:putative membrane protein
MKNLSLSISAVAVVFTMYSCNSGAKKSENSAGLAGTPSSYDSATTVPDASDTSSNFNTTFAVKAGAGGMMEVELGTLAQQVAQNPRVKRFGAMMVKDHTKANTELMALATSKGINIPSALPADIQHHVDEMKKMKGADFDKHYMSMMTDDHKEDIALFEKASQNAPDAGIKAFATKTLPVLNMHLDSAKAIKDAID